jgi:hypothetical protein
MLRPHLDLAQHHERTADSAKCSLEARSTLLRVERVCRDVPSHLDEAHSNAQRRATFSRQRDFAHERTRKAAFMSRRVRPPGCKISPRRAESRRTRTAFPDPERRVLKADPPEISG